MDTHYIFQSSCNKMGFTRKEKAKPKAKPKPISRSSGNVLKDENGDKFGRLNYKGKVRKVALKATLRTDKTKRNPFSRSCSSVKKNKFFMGSNGEFGNARQVFDERFQNRPKKSFQSNKVDDYEDGFGKEEKNKLIKLFRERYELLKKKQKQGGTNFRCKQRLDMDAWMELKESRELPVFSRTFEHVKGVDIGDEFKLRVELVIVGLHSRTSHGIDYVQIPDGRVLATCVVATEGYLDIMRPNVLMYTGEGGKVKDQELKSGNLALKNSFKAGNCVRVVRGIKPGFGNVNARTKKTIFVYDGLYKVVNLEKIMGPYGKVMFQFELRRCPGQDVVVWEKYK